MEVPYRVLLRSLATAGLLAGLTAAAGSAQQALPQPAAPSQRSVFTGATDLIEVQAVVTDKRGGVVRGLARDDFQVTEDGRPQDVTAFAFVDIPLPSPSATGGASVTRVAAPDVATNVLPHERRIYVLVLDAFNVDATRSTQVRKLARQFIDQSLGPTDLAAVLLLGHNAANQPFTSNKVLLTSAVEQFIGQKSQSATLNIQKNASALAGGTKSPEMAAEDAEAGAKANEAQIMLASLKQVCESLGRSPADRRAIVLFSEGIEFDTSNMIGEDKRPGASVVGGGQGLSHETSKYAGAVLDAEQDLFDAARRANVALYTIEPRGNSAGNEDIMNTTDTRDPLTNRPMAPAALTMMNEAQRGQGSLRTFASESGGLAVVGTDRFAAGFSHIVQATSSYYVLGYRPANATQDGTYRKIAVTVKGRPDVEIVARKGYFAGLASRRPASPAPAIAPSVPVPNAASLKMKELLGADLPMRRGLDLRVSGGAVRSQDDKTLVAMVVEIDTSALPFTEQNGLLANDIEMAFLALDAQGTMAAGNRSVGNLRLPPAQRDGVTHGLRYIVEFPVPPGVYQVRVGVHESAGDGGGSAFLDVEAPNYEKVALALGTMLLTTPAAQRVPTTGSFPFVKASLPAPPTTMREFAAGDTLTVLVNVLGSDVRAGGVTLASVIRGADGREMSRRSIDLGAPDLSADRSGDTRAVPVALDGLAPAAYEIAFEATSAAGHKASQAIAILVR